MNWTQDKPALAESSRKFIDKAISWPDPLVAIACHAQATSDQIAWLLLGCALHQGLTLDALSLFLAKLMDAIGIQELCRIPAPKEGLILDCLQKWAPTGEWELAPHVPGIIWSVGQFVRNRGIQFDAWALQAAPRDIWRDCGEIHFMGRSSALRPKVLEFLHRISAPFPAGLGIVLSNVGGRPPLPASMGARRWLSWIGPYEVMGYADATPARRLQLIGEVYKDLKVEEAWKSCHSLQFFTEPAREGYLCSQLMGGCKMCPLCNDCLRSEYQGYTNHANR